MAKQILNTTYISSLCMELHLMMQAGIPLDEGFAILRDGEENSGIRTHLNQVHEILLDGYPLCHALEQTGVFPRYLVDMVRVGEETGNLERGLKSLSQYYDRQEQLVQNIRKAVLYPTALLTMLLVVMAVLVIKVLPMFQDVYAQLGGTMGGLGAQLLNLGTVLQNHGIAVLVGILAVLTLVGVLLFREQKNGARILLSKKLGQSVATAKMASVLAMALHSGLDMDSSLELAESLTQHPELGRKLKNCRVKMEQGESFAQSITGEKLFSSLHCRMLAVGMQTGAIDSVMDDLAVRCDNHAQDEIDRYVANVEPTLVIIMSVLVGVVLLSVMLPLASMMSTLG